MHRIHIEEINHTVLLHMTERMGYKHSEVLSAVLTNRACHTLAVYFLLNKKMKRLSKEYRVSMMLSGTMISCLDIFIINFTILLNTRILFSTFCTLSGTMSDHL